MTRIRFAPLLFLALPAFGNVVMPIEVSIDVAAPREHAREARVERDREEQLYDRATEALDDHDWQRAARMFRQVADQKGEHADASLYWLAYANNKQGLKGDALAALAELERAYPKSRWIEDGKALEVEVRQSSGQHIEFSYITDEDTKVIALGALMDSDPDEAVRIGKKILDGAEKTKVKDRVLFVFSQSGDPRAISIVSSCAKDGTKPEIQRRAVRYLAGVPGDATKKALNEVYATTKDEVVRRAVMKAFLISGDRQQLLMLAKTEPDMDLRADAITELGALGARNELVDLYKPGTPVPIRKRIIQAMFIGGNPEKVASLYAGENDVDVRRTMIESLFFMGAAKQLKELAAKEKDASLRQQIEEKLERLRE